MTLQYTVELIMFLWKAGAQSRASVQVALGPKGMYAEGKNRAFRNDGDKVFMAQGVSFFALKHLGPLGTKIARWHFCPELTQLRNHFPDLQRAYVLEELNRL